MSNSHAAFRGQSGNNLVAARTVRMVTFNQKETKTYVTTSWCRIA